MTTNKIELFLVDRDPIFRLGLSVALKAFPDLVIISQEDTAMATLGQLAQGIIPDILVIEMDSVEFKNKNFNGQEFCKILREAYPKLPVFLLASSLNYQELNILRNLGVRGYISKGSSIETIVYALRQVAKGEYYWLIDDNFSDDSGWVKNTISHIIQSGKQQIDLDITKITNQLKNNNLSLINKILLSGKKRELNVARWLVNQIAQDQNTLISNQEPATPRLPNNNQNKSYFPDKLMLAVVDNGRIAAKVFNQVIAKISLGIVNKTDFFLEIDILQPAKKQELLYLILDGLGKIVESISIETEINSDYYLQELWQQCTFDFFFNNAPQKIFIDERKFRVLLEQEIDNIQKTILSQIYLVEDVVNYLGKEKPMYIDNVLYRNESPEAINRAIILVENILINLANGVMQVILNNFADWETFKYHLYDSSYRSTREIARFRNELSWRYRQDIYWEHPRNIFESRYRFFILSNGIIETLYLYAPRTEELYQLQGLPWFTTIMLEVRDAIAPRLTSVFGLVGSGFVFVLTQVIGKGLGLIARGILQGVGSTLQDVRKSKREK